MKMCEGEIKRDFPNSYVDAAVFRQFFTLPGILEELKRKEKLSPIVVIHLGSNGRIPKKSFDKMVQLLEGHQVFLLNCVVSKSWEREVNQLLEQEISKHSNLHLIDWYQYAKGQSSWFYK
ncbi:acetyltransferase, partial [Fusobacterium necrophorum]|nr:acetyltransferase [Fusobacterium necrophorum]